MRSIIIKTQKGNFRLQISIDWIKVKDVDILCFSFFSRTIKYCVFKWHWEVFYLHKSDKFIFNNKIKYEGDKKKPY